LLVVGYGGLALRGIRMKLSIDNHRQRS